MSDIESNKLDLLQLYRETYNKLTVEYISDNQESVIKTLLDSFLNGEVIPSIKREEKYFSPFLLHNLLDDVYYPILYYKIEFDENGFKDSKEKPIVNFLAMNFLTNLRINIDYDFKDENLNFYQYVLNEITKYTMLDKVELVPCFNFFSNDILNYNSNMTFLNEYFFGEETLSKYDALFKEVKDETFESKIYNTTFGFFSRQDRINQRVENYSGTKVFVSDKHILDSFVFEAIKKSLTDNENFLLLVDNSDKEYINDLLKKNHLDTLSTIDASSNNLIDRKQEQLISFEQKKDEIYSQLSWLNVPEVIECVNNSKFSYDDLINLNLNDYSKDDLDKDLNFFNKIDELKSFTSCDLTSLDYYGLTSENSRENYDELISIVDALKDKVIELNDLITSDLTKTYIQQEIHCINDLDNIIEFATLLNGYNGFPRKYFNLDENIYSQYNLNTLKELFQKTSSSQLVIKEFCYDEIFKNKYLARCEKKFSFFKKLIYKHIIRKYLKKDVKANLDTLLEVIVLYTQSKTLLDSMIKKYSEIYGNNVENMNGVIEIESNVKYAISFNEFCKTKTQYNILDPFIKKLLKNKEYRFEYIQTVNSLSKLASSVKDLIIKYQCFYREKNTNQFYELDFNEFVLLLNKESTYPYAEFDEYLKFIELKNLSSLQLQLILNRKSIKQYTFDQLKELYLYSLTYLKYESIKSQFDKYKNDYTQIKNDTIHSISSLHDLNDYSFINRLANKESSLFILDSKELYKYDENYFDTALIFNSVKFDSISLLSSFRISKKRIFLNQDESDVRISGYQESILNKNNFYYQSFEYSTISHSIIEKLKTMCKENNAELEINDEAFPLVIKYNGLNYGLLPKNLITYKIDTYSLKELMKYLRTYEDIILVTFDIFDFIFDENQLINLLFKK